MRVCHIGIQFGNIDEGMKKVSCQLHSNLSNKVETIFLNTSDARKPSFYKKILSFRPEVVHFLTGPSLTSFLITKSLKFICPEASTIMSAVYPEISNNSVPIIKQCVPDLVLAQSSSTYRRFRDLNMNTAIFPISGVDVEKFVPVNRHEKMALRKKFGVPTDKIVFLHVGHIRSSRNVQVLADLQQLEGVQTVLVGSTSTAQEQDLKDHLIDQGCIVISNFLPAIEEVYQLSDRYIFPIVDDNASIQMPLSVLEAMACNLPIITTRFGAIPDLFTSDDGLIFVHGPQEMKEAVSEHISDTMIRSKVLRFSWPSIAEGLMNIYSECIAGRAEQVPEALEKCEFSSY